MSYSFRRKFDYEDIDCRTYHFIRGVIIRYTALFVWTAALCAVVIILVCGDRIEDIVV
jgi:hypothetical protein